MSLFSDIEKTIERGFRKWTDRVFGAAESEELVLVHRAVLEEIEGRIQTAQRGKQVFPYNHLTVLLPSPNPDRRALYLTAFAEDGRLEKDIREALSGAGCEVPKHLTVEIETPESGERSILYAVRRSQRSEPKPARLTVVRGIARQPEYLISRERVNIGRLEEITDSEQRVVRRNDIVFDEGADEANATVSRKHAHIRRDPANGEYRLIDEGSEYGTRVFREGRTIEVPPGGKRGEQLRPGDEIYFGRACLRFDL